jgi:nicotinamidase-related amidase
MALLVIDMQRDFLDPAGYVAQTGVDVSILRRAFKQRRAAGSGRHSID